jgi:hypothetical protein
MNTIYDVLPSGLYMRFFLPGRESFFQTLLLFLYVTHTSKDKNSFLYFDVCTMLLVRFSIQTNKCTKHTHTHTHIYIYTYIHNILYIVSTPTCFDASAFASGSLILLLC